MNQFFSSTSTTHRWSNFKSTNSIHKRRAESAKLLTKYSDRRPFIVEPADKKSHDTPTLDKTKFLVPQDLTMGQFFAAVRKRVQLRSDQNLFFFVNGQSPPIHESIGALYQRIQNEEFHDDRDGFIYIYYCCESTFGGRTTGD